MMKYLVLAAPFVVLFIFLSFPDLAMTQDLGRHLKIGEIIHSCRCVPDTNFFSFTQPNHAFINHHWFSELVFYLLYSKWGLSSLMILKVIAVILSFAAVLWIALQRSSWYFAGTTGVVFAYIFSERFYTRPELFSFVFLATVLVCLFQYTEKNNSKWLLPIPLVQLLWTNSHIYFPVGFGLVLLVIIQRYLTKRPVTKSLLVVLFLTGIALLLNPHGLNGALYPLRILDNYGYSIVENQNIFFLNTYFFNPRILVFELTAFTFMVLMVIARSRNQMFWLMTSLLSMGAAFVMIRNFSLFALAGAPYFSWLFARVTQLLENGKARAVRVICIIFVLVLTMWVVVIRISSQTDWFVYEPSAEGATSFFLRHRLEGPIFNNFDIGSHLIAQLYPRERVFIDGRPEAYSEDFINIYKKMQEDPRIFDIQDNKYHFNTIIFAHTDITPWAQTFMSWIVQKDDWVPVFVDEKMVIFVKNTEKNKRVIDAYRIRLINE